MTLADVEKLFKKRGESFIFDGGYMEVRIPQGYFQSGYANRLSDMISTIGLFTDMRIWKGKDSSGKYEKIQWTTPSTIETIPSDVRREGDDMVLCYSKGDTFVLSTTVVVDWKNASAVNKAMFGGKLIGIPFAEVAPLIIDAFKTNQVGTGIPLIYIMGYIAESARSESDPTKKLRLMSNVDPMTTDYKFVPIKKLPAYTSTGTALSFENIHSGLATRLVTQDKINEQSTIERSVLRNEPELDD